MKTLVIELEAYAEDQHKLNRSVYQFSKKIEFIPNNANLIQITLFTGFTCCKCDCT